MHRGRTDLDDVCARAPLLQSSLLPHALRRRRPPPPPSPSRHALASKLLSVAAAARLTASCLRRRRRRRRACPVCRRRFPLRMATEENVRRARSARRAQRRLEWRRAQRRMKARRAGRSGRARRRVRHASSALLGRRRRRPRLSLSLLSPLPWNRRPPSPPLLLPTQRSVWPRCRRREEAGASPRPRPA